MQETTRLVQFPTPSPTFFIVSGLALVFMVIAAVSIVYYQRIQARRKRLHAEWRNVHEIVKDRELPENECHLLEDIIHRHRPLAPLRAVTVRQDFDECVEREMTRLKAARNGEDYRRVGEQLRDIRQQLGLDYVPFGQKIESTRELCSGQWMSMAHAQSASPQWTRMRIDRVDEAYFYVSAHPKPDEPLPAFRANDSVRCRLWRDEDARYTFTTSVASFDDPPPSWQMNHTDDLNRVQARDHFRVRYDQSTTVGVLNASVDGSDTDASKRRVVTRLRGRITSLSAGGCALVVPQEVSRQVLLRIELDVDENQPMEVEARIVATSPISGGRMLVRSAFVGLDDEHRDRIAKYVHKRQQHIIAAREATR